MVSVTTGCVGPFSDEIETRYADVAAARAEGAFERGWLPEIIPEAARDIRELHDLDTNESWCCFSVPGGPEGVRSTLVTVSATRLAPGARLRGGEGAPFWWSDDMTSSEVQVYQFREDDGGYVQVGLLPSGETVCFLRGGS